jgi:hypothetical protein
MDFVIVTVPKPPASMQLISPWTATALNAAAKVWQG